LIPFITLHFTAGLTNADYNFKYVELLQGTGRFINYLGYVSNDWLSSSCLCLLLLLHIKIQPTSESNTPIPATVPSDVYAYNRLIAGIAGSNPAEIMDVHLTFI